MQTVIRVENLSKRFRIGKLRQDEGTLRDLVGNIIKSPFKNRAKKQKTENLWALQDASFEVKQGETFGIVGGNGAGKSTLLKILSRIVKPTSGRAIMDGRVGSLLEIGTGFHQDLTGRENIFLNGAVLGMRRHEVEKKFDEIVAFSDLEKFLDTPVKFYSSGMYARLAFAVAAHLEPEILIIDEVLAVGDAAFQAKCLGKMGKVAEGGRTVLFVSHDASAVTKLCKTGIYLEHGKIKTHGDIKDVMAQYKADYEPVLPVAEKRPRTIEQIAEGECRFIEWNVVQSNAGIPHTLIANEDAALEFVFAAKIPTSEIRFRIMIRDADGRTILSSDQTNQVSEGVHALRLSARFPLNAGSYKIFAEAFLPAENTVRLDVWECEPDLLILPDTPAANNEIQSLLNIPTSISFVRK